MSDTQLLARPEVALGGIDFSGGQEHTTRGNKKICVAQWLPDNGVSLRCGRDWNDPGPLRRRDLPALIKLGGWWSLDFPFGVAHPIARILGVRTWPDWLSYCDQNLNATAIRNNAKALTIQSGVRWAMRRQVDESQNTTWFPLFEQLYRQTIYGAREVLLPLYVDDVCILPWKASALPAPVVVAEGFPGATNRDVLKLPVSYKGRDAERKLARRMIISALRSAPFAIPISDEIADTAVDDHEGDAVDALVLLLSSWMAYLLPHKQWTEELLRLQDSEATSEGWFPIKA